MGEVNGSSGGMRFRPPTAASAEVRDATGERLRTLGARLEGGTIVIDVPAFAHGTTGTVTLLVDGHLVERTLTPRADDLPTEAMQSVIEFREEEGPAASPQPEALLS